MAKFLYSRLAETDTDQIVDYIWEDNPTAAVRFVDEVERVCKLLGDMPHMGTKVDFITTLNFHMFPVGKFNSYLIFYVLKLDYGKTNLRCAK